MPNQVTTETLSPITPLEYRDLIRDFFRDHDDTLWRIETDSVMFSVDGITYECEVFYRELRILEVTGDCYATHTLAEQDAVRKALALLQEKQEGEGS